MRNIPTKGGAHEQYIKPLHTVPKRLTAPGHAMKVTDHSKSAGTIIGKAMSKLENGKGLVLVLVSLQ